jgi:hypothetical protein
VQHVVEHRVQHVVVEQIEQSVVEDNRFDERSDIEEQFGEQNDRRIEDHSKRHVIEVRHIETFRQ